MPRLAELQALFAQALLDDPGRLPPALFAAGPIAAEAALRVHRNTVLGALAKALALNVPTVAALVGEACFDQVAAAYAAARPPAATRLALYGDAFPEFLETCPQTAALDYLADVARFDLAIGRAGAAPLAARLIEIDRDVTLSLPVSLAVLELRFPAEQIRDAVETGDDDALAAIDLTPRAQWRAVWRDEAAARVRPSSPPAGRFLSALLAGHPSEDALAAAMAAEDAQAALHAIQSEVFAAPFAAILQTPKTEPDPERDAQP